MSRDIKKVLVIKLGALGDFVQSLAAMKHIREAHPKAKITLLTTPPYEALARASPYVNDVETDGRPDTIADWWSMIARLRRTHYDRVYDLQTSGRSSRIFYALLPFAPPWSGIAVGCAFPHKNRNRNRMHTLERQADQLRAAGIWPDAPTEPGSAPPPDLSWILTKASERARAAPKPYVLMAPGASAHRPEKRWPAEKFGELAAAFRGRGYDIVVLGGPQESALARAIQKSAPQARDLTGRTDFAQLAALGARASLAVTNDTGPSHLIAGAGAPTIVMFSKASDPSLCAPRGHVAVMQAEDLSQLPVAQVLATATTLLPSS